MKEHICDTITGFINRTVELTEQEAELISSHSREVSFSKGELLTRDGLHSKYTYFILSGKARSYHTDEQGKKITWFFHFNSPYGCAKNHFATDYKSFLTNTPGSLTIEALTDVRAVQLSTANIEYLAEHIPAFNRWIRKLDQEFFMTVYERVFTLMTMSATQRYEKMLKDEPHLQQMFSNDYVASYLSLAPQSLSRIKNFVSHHHLAVAV